MNVDFKKRNYCETHEFISKSKNQLYSNVRNKWCLQLIARLTRLSQQMFLSDKK